MPSGENTKDTRPRLTTGSDEMQAIYKDCGDRALDIMREAFDRASALEEGTAPERLHNAVSLIVEIAASGALLAMAKLGEGKPDVDGAAIYYGVIVDLQERVQRGLSQFAEYGTATRQ